jgi:hypothetical protein
VEAGLAVVAAARDLPQRRALARLLQTLAAGGPAGAPSSREPRGAGASSGANAHQAENAARAAEAPDPGREGARGGNGAASEAAGAAAAPDAERQGWASEGVRGGAGRGAGAAAAVPEGLLARLRDLQTGLDALARLPAPWDARLAHLAGAPGPPPAGPACARAPGCGSTPELFWQQAGSVCRQWRFAADLVDLLRGLRGAPCAGQPHVTCFQLPGLLRVFSAQGILVRGVFQACKPALHGRAGQPALLLESLILAQQFPAAGALLSALPALRDDALLLRYARCASQPARPPSAPHTRAGFPDAGRPCAAHMAPALCRMGPLARRTC